MDFNKPTHVGDPPRDVSREKNALFGMLTKEFGNTTDRTWDPTKADGDIDEKYLGITQFSRSFTEEQISAQLSKLSITQESEDTNNFTPQYSSELPLASSK